MYLNPDFVAIPISANDAVVSALEAKGIKLKQTKIGSPYVVKAMSDERAINPDSKVVSWESNGGFLLGSQWNINGKSLKPLPTRDAALPLIATILLAIQGNRSVSELISSTLPSRFTHADVVDDKTLGCETYTADMGKTIIKYFSPAEDNIDQVDFFNSGCVFKNADGKIVTAEGAQQRLELIKGRLEKYFSEEEGFSGIKSINFVDGIRITFINNDVAHLRPSGNAPEFRMYATADTQGRADEIVAMRGKIVPEIIEDIRVL